MKLRLLFLLMVAAWLIFSAQAANAESYVVPRNMTAGELAKELGVSFRILKEANPNIKAVGTKLKKGSKINLPNSSTNTYYSQNYLAQFGGLYFWNPELRGYLLSTHLEYLYSLNSKAKSGWAFGAFADAIGGGMWLESGAYNEPAISWQGGARIRLKSPGIYYDLLLGYGQNYLSGQMGTGFKQALFSHYLLSRLVFHPYSDRFMGQTSWFTDVELYGEAKIPLKEDKMFWSQKPINLELLPQKLTLGGELTIIDWRLSEKFLLPIGVTMSYNQYDFETPKFFFEYGGFIEPFYNQRQIGRIFFDYQAGASGVHFGRYILGVNLDFGLFLNKNEPKKNLINTRRSR